MREKFARVLLAAVAGFSAVCLPLLAGAPPALGNFSAGAQRSAAPGAIGPLDAAGGDLRGTIRGEGAAPTGFSGAAAGGTYYVSPSGSDANPGTEAQPWQTVQKAADTMLAGDTVYVRAGEYYERISPQNSGSEGSWITYAAYPGEAATIDGTGVDIPEWSGLIDVTNKAFIRVSGLRVVNARTNPHNPGILADTCDHILFEKCYVSNTNDSGIAAWSSSYVTIDGNEVANACQAGWNECISVGGTAQFEVKNNLVHHSPKEGICLKDASSFGKVYGNEVHHTEAVGFYVDAQDDYTHDIEVYGNSSHDGTENGFSVASEVGGLLENVKVYNNVAYRNGWCGFEVSKCCIGTHPITNVLFANNTSYDNGKAGWGGGIFVENTQTQGVVIRNNVCSQSLTFQIVVVADVPAASYVADHNLIDGFRGDPDEIRGADYVEGDPLFADAAGGDFHIPAASPAVGKGSSEATPTVDFDDYPRGTPPDIGAFEHRSSSACTLACTADAPATAERGAGVGFAATATPSGACTGGVSYDWDFGDGSAHAPTAQAQHAYASEGAFSWRMTASVSGVSCTRTGTITVAPPVTPPVISGVSQSGGPFKIKISGGNFQSGVQVFLGSDTSPWGNTTRKSETLVVLKGGSSLKARFPSGQAVAIRVANPDGGEASTTYTRP